MSILQLLLSIQVVLSIELSHCVWNEIYTFYFNLGWSTQQLPFSLGVLKFKRFTFCLLRVVVSFQNNIQYLPLHIPIPLRFCVTLCKDLLLLHGVALTFYSNAILFLKKFSVKWSLLDNILLYKKYSVSFSPN